MRRVSALAAFLGELAMFVALRQFAGLLIRKY